MAGRKKAAEYDRIVGERLRALRESRGRSLADVGTLLEVSYQQMQKYEVGKNRLSAGKARLLAEEFGVPLEALFVVDSGTETEIDWEMLAACETVVNKLTRAQLLRILHALSQ